MNGNRPPGSFRDLCMAVFYLVPARRVRGAVPPFLKINEVVAGLTIGGVYAARYERDGAPASEFGLLPAYVTYEGRSGFYMRQLHAEGETCRDTGAAISFRWDAGPRWVSVEVNSGGSPQIAIRMRAVIDEIPVNASLPLICVKGSNLVYIKQHFARRIGVSISTVTVPPESALHLPPFGMKLISTFWDASNVVLKEPEYITARVMEGAEKALGSPIGKGI